MNDTQVTAAVTKDLTWLQAHERLIIVFLVLLVGGWLGNHWLNNSAAEAKTALVAQQQISQAAASQAAQAALDYQKAIDALSKENVALAASQVTRQTVLAKQQAATVSFPPDQVVTMWQGLIPNTNKGNIVPTSDGGYKVDGGPAIDTVNMLEEVPVLKADLADETKLADNTQTALNSCGTAIVAEKNSHEQDKKESADKIASLKADARKSKRNWFFAGFISGIATRLLLKF